MIDITPTRTPAATRIALAALVVAALATVLLLVTAVAAGAQDAAPSQNREVSGYTDTGTLAETVLSVVGNPVRSFDLEGSGFLLVLDGNTPFDIATTSTVTITDPAMLSQFSGAASVPVRIITQADSGSSGIVGDSLIQVDTPFSIGVAVQHRAASITLSMVAPDAGEAVVEGSQVDWTISVTNAGDVPVSDIVVTVDGDPLCTIDALDVGVVDSCTTTEVAASDTTHTAAASGLSGSFAVQAATTAGYSTGAVEGDQVLGIVVTAQEDGEGDEGEGEGDTAPDEGDDADPDAPADDAESGEGAEAGDGDGAEAAPADGNDDAAQPQQLAETGDDGHTAAAIALIVSGAGIVLLSASEAMRRRHTLLEA